MRPSLKYLRRFFYLMTILLLHFQAKITKFDLKINDLILERKICILVVN